MEYTQAATLTIHSLRAKSNVSICVGGRRSVLTSEKQFPWTSLSIRIKGMKSSDFQRTMRFNLTIPNMFQWNKTKSLTVPVWTISSPHTSWKVLYFSLLLLLFLELSNLGFGNLSQSQDFRLDPFFFFCSIQVSERSGQIYQHPCSTQDW